MTSTNRAPRQKTPGWPGEAKKLRLELRVLADVGLLGMPNAGKSTLIASISNARPKIADYPFTTLSPNLGVVRLAADAEFVLADIPGLIEGAHEGQGLGDRFLGHVERTRVLLHLIDGTQEDVVAAYQTIRGELAAYGNGLAEKPERVALNKIDALSEDEIAAKSAALAAAAGQPVALVSAAGGQGVEPLLFELLHRIRAARQQELEEAPRDAV